MDTSVGKNSLDSIDMNKIEQAIRKISGENDIFSENFNSSYSSVEEIERMENHLDLSNVELRKKKIIFPAMKEKSLVNSFRDLRTQLTGDREKNIIMVTSICENSGNSFFARNIAVATAFDVSKTAILFDCSIGSNDVGDLFGLPDEKGIINYIFDNEARVEDIIHESGIKRLRIIPFGRSEQAIGEHFSHPRFQNLLSQLKHKYSERHLFIDAPPILESADSHILLSLCDQVVLVVPYGRANLSDIQAATDIIGKDKFKGVVFNDYIK